MRGMRAIPCENPGWFVDFANDVLGAYLTPTFSPRHYHKNRHLPESKSDPLARDVTSPQSLGRTGLPY